MKKIILSMDSFLPFRGLGGLFLTVAAAAIIFAGCSKDDDDVVKTPPYAASTQTWTFGSQTWSDAIQCPECDRESFSVSETESQCRSYTASGTTRYYYNWAYVHQNAAKLCPSPWRVPTKSDFETFHNNTDAIDMVNAWGFGGYANGSSMYLVNTQAYYWMSVSSYYYYGYGDPVEAVISYGMQVRCVK